MVRKVTTRKWPFLVALLFVAVAFAIAGIAFAKMTADPLDVDNSVMQIAKWNNAVTSDYESVNLIAGNATESYNFTVTNNSDVSDKYEIIVSGIPEGVLVGLDEGGLIEPTNGEVEFADDSYVLNIGGHRDHTLNVKATIDAEETVDAATLTINVNFEQKKLLQEEQP
jgi:hypothetical protein